MDLPDPGIETGSPALQAESLPSEPPRKLRSIQQAFIPYVPGVSRGCLGGIVALGWDCSPMRGQLAFGCYKLASVGVTRVSGSTVHVSLPAVDYWVCSYDNDRAGA